MTNKTILFTAELGSGLGHVAPLVRIVERLEKASKDVGLSINAVFAAGNGIDARAITDCRKYPILPVPLLETPEIIKSHSSSYSEILASYGYTRHSHLSAALSAWDDIINLVQPDLIVAEHSPTVCLAARDRIPTLIVGNGYTMPPANIPVFPALKVGMAPPVVQHSILEVVNSLLKRRGQKQLARLPELLKGSARAVFSLPQFDPYAGLRSEPLLGSYHADLAPAPLPEKPHVFLYFGDRARHLDKIVQTAAQTGAIIAAYLGPTETPAKQFLKNRGAKVYDEPPSISGILKEVSIVVSNGGAGLAHAATIVGRPQIVIPIHAESQITAGRIESMGLGLAIENNVKEELEGAFDILLQAGSYSETALQVAGLLQKQMLSNDPVGDVAQMALGPLKS